MPLLTKPVQHISKQYKSNCNNPHRNKNHNTNRNIRMHIIRKIAIAPLIQSDNHFSYTTTILPAVFKPPGNRAGNILIHKKNISCLYHTDKTKCPCPDAQSNCLLLKGGLQPSLHICFHILLYPAGLFPDTSVKGII